MHIASDLWRAFYDEKRGVPQAVSQRDTTLGPYRKQFTGKVLRRKSVVSLRLA